MGYAEHAPPPDLAPYVACFWTGASSPVPTCRAVHRVLPDGCVDIIFAFGRQGGSTGDAREAIGVGR